MQTKGKINGTSAEHSQIFMEFSVIKPAVLFPATQEGSGQR